MTKRLLIPKSWSGIRLFMSLLLLVTATFPMLALRLDQSEMTLKRGTTVELTATRGTEAGALSWVVKPEGIASIKPYATNPLICGVTGEKAGDAVVTAQVGTSTTAVMQNCKVKVWDLAIESTDLVLTEGDKIDLAEKVQGVNLPEGWEIMFNVADRDNNVVSLSGSTLEAKAAGSTDINADLFNVNGLEERVVIKVTVKAKEINAKSITLNYKEANLTEGETLLLEAIVDPVNATVPVIWTSSDENVVTVDETGKVVAVKPGKGVITATAKTATGTTEATCAVDVKAKEINAKSITLNYKEANLTEGETLLLEAIVDPVNATVPVIWTSSDENVVTVDETGKVVAVKPGKGVITATAKTATGTTEATCAVDVKAKEINAKSITLNYKEANLTEGETLLLEAIIDPVNATVPVMWTSSDKAVATVDEVGKVVAVKPGKAVITATAKTATGTTEATCAVEVKAKEISAKSITLNFTVANIIEGQTLLLEAIVEPENATVPVVWSSSDKTVVTVDEVGKVVAVKPGKAVITASAKTATNDIIKAECAVEVVAKPISAKSIKLNYNEANLAEGETLQLEAIVEPENSNVGIVWSSSDETVATVDETGKVVAVKAGKAVITASTKTATGDNITDECVVEVRAKQVGEIIAPEQFSVIAGSKFSVPQSGLIAIKAPEGSTLMYTMPKAQADIAYVDGTGVITAVNPGEIVLAVDLYSPDGELLVGKEITVVVEAKPVEGTISFKFPTRKLTVGDQTLLNPDIEGSEGIYVMYSSDNTEVATVNVRGVVTAVGEGTAIITANLMKGTDVVVASATAEITVLSITPAPNYTVTLDFDEAEMKVGETLYIPAILRPAVKKGEVRWISSDDNIAMADENGKVTAYAEGTVTFNVNWIIDGMTRATATCTITVLAADPAPVAPSISFAEENVSIEAGQTATLNVALVNIDPTEVKWLSYDKSVVTVDANGVITAVAPGTAKVMAYVGAATNPDVKAECVVTVSEAEPEMVVEIIAPAELNLTVGDEFELNRAIAVKGKPEGGFILFTTADRDIAPVTGTGLVTAGTAGVTTITVDLYDAEGQLVASATTTVNVAALPVAPAISFAAASETVKPGMTVVLSPVVTGDLPEGWYVMYSSSDVAVATVNPAGNVEAVSEGTATITANVMKGTENVLASATIEIVVMGQPALPTFTLDIPASEIEEGKDMLVQATLPADAPEGSYVLWSSSDESVVAATTSGTGSIEDAMNCRGRITAVGEGTATVTATWYKGTFAIATVTFEVTVKGVVKGITVNPAEATIYDDEILELSVILDAGETADKTITWKSSNEKVATVDSNGRVKAVSKGTAHIEAKAASGHSHACFVTVNRTPQVTGIESVEGDASGITVEGNNIIVPEGAEVYTISGVAVKPVNLATGIYIVRFANGKAVKVVI